MVRASREKFRSNPTKIDLCQIFSFPKRKAANKNFKENWEILII